MLLQRPWSRLGIGLAIGLVMLVAAGRSRADEWFIQVAGVPGEITNGPLAGWSRLSAIQPLLKPGNPATGVGVFACEVRKGPDRLSPAFFKAGATGERIRRVNLAFQQSQPAATRSRVTLEDCLVTSWSNGASGSAGVETVRFEARIVEWACFEVDPAGGNAGGIVAIVDISTGAGVLKQRRPFRAAIESQAGRDGVVVSCPVAGGHRYRILGLPRNGAAWRSLREFTAAEDGEAREFLPLAEPVLLMRVEEVD